MEYRGSTELALMRQLKRALDPQGLLNPGKVI
jgi:FAD/FMN-containing dehydrogenase